jgi:hypothetical protein
VVADCEARNIKPPKLPDLNYLPSVLHVHMSGAAQQNDEIMDDLETIVMADDGSTADLTTSLLLQIPAVA